MEDERPFGSESLRLEEEEIKKARHKAPRSQLLVLVWQSGLDFSAPEMLRHICCEAVASEISFVGQEYHAVVFLDQLLRRTAEEHECRLRARRADFFNECCSRSESVQ